MKLFYWESTTSLPGFALIAVAEDIEQAKQFIRLSVPRPSGQIISQAMLDMQINSYMIIMKLVDKTLDNEEPVILEFPAGIFIDHG